MTAKKPNKLDVRMRYVKTHAVELDCEEFKKFTTLFDGRIGEYTETQEVFVPGSLIRELRKAFSKPGMSEVMIGAITELIEKLAPLVSPYPSAVRMGINAGRKVGDAIKGTYAPQPASEPVVPDLADMPPPPPWEDIDFGPPPPKKRSRKAKPKVDQNA